MLYDLLLACGGIVCFLVVPATIIALPAALVARRITREKPERRALSVVLATATTAIVLSIALGVAGVCFGMNIGDENAGAALEGLVVTGCVGGFVAGGVVTLAASLYATRPRTS